MEKVMVTSPMFFPHYFVINRDKTFPYELGPCFRTGLSRVTAGYTARAVVFMQVSETNEDIGVRYVGPQEEDTLSSVLYDKLLGHLGDRYNSVIVTMAHGFHASPLARGIIAKAAFGALSYNAVLELGDRSKQRIDRIVVDGAAAFYKFYKEVTGEKYTGFVTEWVKEELKKRRDAAKQRKFEREELERLLKEARLRELSRQERDYNPDDPFPVPEPVDLHSFMNDATWTTTRVVMEWDNTERGGGDE